MEQSLNEILSSKNEMVKKGQIVEATEKYFAPHAKTIDFDGTVTNVSVRPIASGRRQDIIA